MSARERDREAAGAERFALVADDRGGVTVMLDGSPQSHVQHDDPQLLAFDTCSTSLTSSTSFPLVSSR